MTDALAAGAEQPGQDRELPAGWAWAKLGELGVWYGGGTPSKRRPELWENGTIPWLSPKDMGADILTGTQDLIHPSALGASPVKLVPANSIALVIRSGILERTVPIALVPFETTLNQDMKAISPHNGIDARWLAWSLRAAEQHILRKCRKRGTTVASLEVSWLMHIDLAIPPASEQRRIVAKLEENIAHIDAGEAALSSARSRKTELLGKVLDEAVLGSLGCDAAPKLDPSSLDDIKRRAGKKIDYSGIPMLPKGWRWRVAEDVCSLITSGATPKAHLMHSDAGDVPFLKVYNITQSGQIDFSIRPTFVYRKTHEEQLKRSRVRPGDVLTNIVGPPLGKTAVIPADYPEWNINQAIVAFRAGQELAPEWLGILLRSPFVIGMLKRTARATAGQFNIALSTCRELPIPVPPMDQQLSTSRLVASLLERLEIANLGIQVLEERSAQLRSSFLGAAFAGSLVPQDYADEPASVLLDHVRAA